MLCLDFGGYLPNMATIYLSYKSKRVTFVFFCVSVCVSCRQFVVNFNLIDLHFSKQTSPQIVQSRFLFYSLNCLRHSGNVWPTGLNVWFVNPWNNTRLLYTVTLLIYGTVCYLT